MALGDVTETVLELRLTEFGSSPQMKMKDYVFSLAFHGLKRNIFRIRAYTPEDATVEFADHLAYLLTMAKKLKADKFDGQT